VAWERRGESLYYYRSVREDQKVRKEYVGRGEIAEALAHADETMRLSRAERREHERRESAKELERLEALVAPVLELSRTAEILLQAHLIAAGYHHRRGQWRRRRE
jgi:hypothetical protein